MSKPALPKPSLLASGKTFNLSVLGDKDLQARIDALPEVIARRLLRVSLRDAFKRVLNSAKMRAPKDTGALVRSMKLRASKRSGGMLQYKVFTEDTKGLGYRIIKKPGSKGGRTRQGYAPAAHELGYTRQNGVRVAPKAFMRGALNSNKDAVIEHVRQDLWRGLNEYLAGEASKAQVKA